MISTDALARLLSDPNTRVVDASWHLGSRDALAEFQADHIPGAVFFDIDAIADPTTNLPHMLPSPDAFADAVGKLGISEQDHVVVYDSVGMFSAARVWWTFRVMGAAKVQVLDGGLPKWRAEDRATESGPPRPTPTQFKPHFQAELVRDLAGVREELEHGHAQVVDARPAQRFAGMAPEPRAGLRSGHMPGAISQPLGGLVGADGRLLDAGALRTTLVRAGVDPTAPVTATCGSGITAAGIALALARLGNDRAAVYDGSWAEWGSRSDVPVVIEPAT